MPRGGKAGDRQTTSCPEPTSGTGPTDTEKRRAGGRRSRRRGRSVRLAVGATVLSAVAVGPALASTDVAAGSGGSGVSVGAILATTVAVALLCRRR